MFKGYAKVMGYAVLTITIVSVLGWVLKPASMFAERVAIKTSHQYKEGMEQQAAIWEATLVELDVQLIQANSEQERANINGQIRVIKARLMAVTAVK